MARKVSEGAGMSDRRPQREPEKSTHTRGEYTTMEPETYEVDDDLTMSARDEMRADEAREHWMFD